jgi:hypothetical protein
VLPRSVVRTLFLRAFATSRASSPQLRSTGDSREGAKTRSDSYSPPNHCDGSIDIHSSAWLDSLRDCPLSTDRLGLPSIQSLSLLFLRAFATSRASSPQLRSTGDSREGAKTRSDSHSPSTIANEQSISRHLLDWIVFAIARFRPIASAFRQSNPCLFSSFVPSRLRVRPSLSFSRLVTLAKARRREVIRTASRPLRMINRFPGICLTG